MASTVLTLALGSLLELSSTMSDRGLYPLTVLGNSSRGEENAIIIDTMPLVVDTLINGASGNDVLVGDSLGNAIDGQDGNDRLWGQGGVDILTGGSGDDRLWGGQDGDRLSGGEGNDLLIGGSGDDTLAGDDGNDLLRGGSGADSLQGGGGDDQLLGGAGADAFLLDMGNGVDQIQDFKDGIDLLGLPANVTFEQLTVVQVSTGTAIYFGMDHLATLANVNASSLTGEDFRPVIFVA